MSYGLPPLYKKPRRKKRLTGREPVRSPTHRAWVRRHECVVPACNGEYHPEAHHAKTKGAGGGDEWCVSLCRMHHVGLGGVHQGGRRTFMERYGIDLEAIAKRFAEASPDQKIREAAKTMRWNERRR